MWLIAVFSSMCSPVFSTAGKQQLQALGRLDGPAATLDAHAPETIPTLVSPTAPPVYVSGATCGRVVSWTTGSKKRRRTTYFSQIAPHLWVEGKCGSVDTLVYATGTSARLQREGGLERPPVVLERLPSWSDALRRSLQATAFAALAPLGILALALTMTSRPSQVARDPRPLRSPPAPEPAAPAPSFRP